MDRKRTVIIVDDSIFIRNRLRSFFENVLKFEVLAEGGNGEDAVKLYDHFKPDLLTLDIAMPNMRGSEAVQKIMLFYPNANILMISAIRGTGMIECIEFGAKGYIEKPLLFESESFVKDFKQTISDILKIKL